MKRQLSILLLLGTVTGYAHAQSEVFLCVDDSGRKEYKNTGATKGCKRIELPNLTTIPAPPQRAPVQTAAAKPSAAPADFPKVERDAQKARDNDRRVILLEEMKIEEDKLAALKKEYNNGEPERRGDERNYAKYQERVALMKDDINRAEKNIEALKRELNNIK